MRSDLCRSGCGFGAGVASERALAETGESLGVTRERIRQIEARALQKPCNCPKAASC
jgi:DNA-directed RNA polymerase sigma subunit (sigma70/sigma32)